MARSVNKVILMGHLGKDAETRFTPSGASVTNFTLATNRRTKDPQSGDWKDETDWHNIVVWRADNVSPYLLKGKQVFIEGRLQTRSYEDKDGNKRYTTEVVVNAEDVVLIGSRGEGGAGDEAGFSAPPSGQQRSPISMPRSAQPARAQKPAAAPAQDFEPGITDDDVPF